MKKIILIVWSLLIISAFGYSQSEKNSDCTSNIENIFKVHAFKIRYEAVQYLYQNKGGFLCAMSKEEVSHYFALISDLPMDIEERKDSISGERVVTIEMRSEEEMNRYIKQINCTPEEALKEYRDFIQHIKSEKELYLKCINTELAKGDLSEYVKVSIAPYNFLPPGWSLMARPASITKLDFLKVFKEFIFNNNEEVLPEGSTVYEYLKCNCKIL